MSAGPHHPHYARNGTVSYATLRCRSANCRATWTRRSINGSAPSTTRTRCLDRTSQLNIYIYGRSKLEGESAAFEKHPQALILRTSWVCSPFGSNFLRTVLKVGGERSVLKVVNDQAGNPMSASDLAAVILSVAPVLRSEPGGLYHLTGEGSTNWHNFAAFIFQESRKYGDPTPLLEVISSAEYKTAAARPASSQLDCAAFANRFGIKLRPGLRQRQRR